MSEETTGKDWFIRVKEANGDNTLLATAYWEAKNSHLYPIFSIPNTTNAVLVAGSLCILRTERKMPEGYGGGDNPSVEFSIITPKEAIPLLQKALEFFEHQVAETKSVLTTLSSTVG